MIPINQYSPLIKRYINGPKQKHSDFRSLIGLSRIISKNIIQALVDFGLLWWLLELLPPPLLLLPLLLVVDFEFEELFLSLLLLPLDVKLVPLDLALCSPDDFLDFLSFDVDEAELLLLVGVDEFDTFCCNFSADFSSFNVNLPSPSKSMESIMLARSFIEMSRWANFSSPLDT